MTSIAEYERRTKDDIKAQIAARRRAEGAEVKPAPAASPAGPAFFVGEFDDDAGDRVRLSSLVGPLWEAGTSLDPLVTVYSRFGLESEAMIPTVDPNYRPNCEALALFAHAIENTDTAVWLAGVHSAGKTTLGKYFAALTNRPFCRINFNASMSDDDLLGTVTLPGDGSTQWRDGLIPQYMGMQNAIIFLDEPTAAGAETQMALQRVLEKGGELLLNAKPGRIDEKTIRPAPGVRWAMADNTLGQGDPTGRYIGTSPQNVAWLDRPGTFIKVTWLKPSRESEMLRAYQPQVTALLTDKIVRVATLIREACEQGTLSTTMSMRNTQAWCAHCVGLRGDIKQAFMLSYVNRLDDAAEIDAVLEIYRNIFG